MNKNEVKVFDNEEFGQVRTVICNGQPWFVGKDVAMALGYAEPRSAVSKKVDDVDRGVAEMETPSGRQNMTIINESGLYALIFGSKLESAQRFKRWVTAEVLPTLRKTGSYKMPQKQDKQPKKIPLASVNKAVSNIDRIFSRAGVNELYIAAEAKRLYSEAGYEIKIPLITDKETMPKLYDCTEIARELGLYSNGGNPHIMAVSAIIKRLHIAASEIVTTAFSRNGHDDVTVQYKPSVFEEIKLWLAENGYPTKISYTDSKGNPKTCTVVYREVA